MSKRPKLDVSVVESDSSSESLDETVPDPVTELTGEHCWVCNRISGIAHLSAVLDVPGVRTLAWEWNGARKYLRPRCGAQTGLAREAYLVTLDTLTACIHCKRLGCRASGPDTPASAGPAPAMGTYRAD